MAFLSGFVKSGLSLLGKDSSGFPYSLGDKVEFYDHPFWSLHHGRKKVTAHTGKRQER
jgi:SCY1-like protein 1